MQIKEKILKKILVGSDLITQKNFDSAKKIAQEKKEPLEEVIIDQRFISDPELGHLISDYIGFPFINLKKRKLDKKILNILPEIVARKQQTIVFGKTKKGIKVAFLHPENLEMREFIERKVGESVIPFYATRRDITESLRYYRKDIEEEFEKIIKKSLQELEKTRKGSKEEPLPIIKSIDLILNYGYDNRASDIHIEPYAKETVLRYRIDGILHDILTFSITLDKLTSVFIK